MYAVFMGIDGKMPKGGTEGAWTVGKIYNLEDDPEHPKSYWVEKDDRGLPNGWMKSYFTILDQTQIAKIDRVDDITTLFNFLVNRQKQVPGDIWGGHRIEDAIESACRLTGVPKEEVYRIFG